MITCSWCGIRMQIGSDGSHIVCGNGQHQFFACSGCLKIHGRSQDYKEGSDYDKLLTKLGV